MTFTKGTRVVLNQEWGRHCLGHTPICALLAGVMLLLGIPLCVIFGIFGLTIDGIEKMLNNAKPSAQEYYAQCAVGRLEEQGVERQLGHVYVGYPPRRVDSSEDSQTTKKETRNVECV